MKRLKYVDLLRIIAIIAVVVCHYNRALEYSGISTEWSILPDTVFSIYLGNFGVSIFFIISGISLMYTTQKFEIKKYFKKRFLGIYPMFYIAWLIVFMYYFIVNHGSVFQSPPRWSFIWTLLGTDGYFNFFGPNYYLIGEWFLGCLIFLYLLFPIIKYGIDNRPIITAIIIVSIYIIVSIFYNGTIPREIFFPLRIIEFAFGMYFVKYWKKVSIIPGIVSFIVLVFMSFFPFENTFGEQIFQYTIVYRNTIVGMSTVIFVSWFCNYIKAGTFFYFMAKISKYGYAIFLTHHVIITEYAKLFSQQHFDVLKNYVAFFVVSILIAIASVALYRINNKFLNPLPIKSINNTSI